MLDMLTEDQIRQLDEEGCLLLHELMPTGLLDELRRRVAELFAEEGPRAGSEFKTEPGARTAPKAQF